MRNFFFPNFISCAGASVLLAFAIWCPGNAVAQQNGGVEPKRLAVDVVSVKKLGRLHGIVMKEDRQSVSIVVRRAWLEKTLPDFWKEHAASEEAALKKDRETLKQRMESWREDYEGNDRKVIDGFLDDNTKLLNLDAPIDVSDLEFTVVNVDRKLVRRTFTQTQDRHHLAGVAWSERVEGVETTNASVLKRKLEQREVEIEGYELKLGNEIATTLESDQQWEARKALIEFGLLSRVEYQGTNGIFMPRGANVDPGEAMKALMQGGLGGLSQIDQLGKELGLPEFQDKNRGRTRDHQRWLPLASFSNSASVEQQSTDDVDLVEQDPNVARVLDIAKQFGVADEKTLKMALRGGAATKKALEKSMTEMDEFVQEYSFEIDNPPVEQKR